MQAQSGKNMIYLRNSTKWFYQYSFFFYIYSSYSVHEINSALPVLAKESLTFSRNPFGLLERDCRVKRKRKSRRIASKAFFHKSMQDLKNESIKVLLLLFGVVCEGDGSERVRFELRLDGKNRFRVFAFPSRSRISKCMYASRSSINSSTVAL